MEIVWTYFLSPANKKESHSLRQITQGLTEIGVTWREIAYHCREVFAIENEKELARRERFLKKLKRLGIPDSAIVRTIREKEEGRIHSMRCEQIDVGNFEKSKGAIRYPLKDRRTDPRDDPPIEVLDALRGFTFTLLGVTWPDGMGGDLLDQIDILVGHYESVNLHIPISARRTEVEEMVKSFCAALDLKQENPAHIRAILTEEEQAAAVAPFDPGPMAEQKIILDDPGAEAVRKSTDLRLSIARCAESKCFSHIECRTTRAILTEILPRGYRLSVQLFRDKSSTMGIGGRSLGAAASCFLYLEGVNFRHQIHHFGMIRDQKSLDRVASLVLKEAVDIKARLGDTVLSSLLTPAWMWPEWSEPTKPKEGVL